MKYFLFLMLVLSPLVSEAQYDKSPEEWLDFYLNNYGLSEIELSDSLSYLDFSEIFMNTPTNYIYGVIGKNMQRIHIKWISINKDPHNPNSYYVFGKSKVNDNICNFTGIIEVRHIRLYQEGRYDLPYRSKIIPDVIGVVFCDYILTEDSNQNHSGVFKGISATEFFIHDDTLYYNDLRASADDMTNNQFVGKWQAYSNNLELNCNWGDFRVPNVKGFDCGAAEFSPCKEYLRYGWQDLYDAKIKEDQDAVKRETTKWWK